MSRHIRRHIGQLVMAGFPGPTVPDELRAVAREYDLGGVILFGRNVEAPEQVAELAYDAPDDVARSSAVGQCRPGGWSGGAFERAVYGVATDVHVGSKR